MTRSSAKSTSFTLSREMKLLLVLLLLAALIGVWYIWTSGRTAEPEAQSPTGSPNTGSPNTSPAAGAPAEAAQGPQGAVAVQPGSQVDVPTLPPYSTPETSAPATPAADTPPTPSGINPDTPLAALPSVNPFRPLALDANSTPSAPQSAPSSPRSTPAASLSQPVTPPVVTPAPVSGALAISPIPGSGGAVKVETPVVTGGAFPTPTLPGAGRSGPEPEVVTLTPPATVTPQSQPRTPSARQPSSAAPAPVRPPLAGMSVPQSSIDLTGTLASPSAEKGNSAATAGASSAPVTSLPVPGTPQPITQLGVEGEEASASAEPASVLDRLIESRDLTLNAAVLGPVNTAIFHARDGFLVVSVGQSLPDSDVVVREVTAHSVTLALGNDTKTLELDKR